MVLINEHTGESQKGIIEKIEGSEVDSLKGNSDFTFEWKREKGTEIYKLTIEGENEILGLMSIIDIREELRIHINLIEASKKHRGKKKKLKNIPGCLIGFTCRIAFKKGYGGFVSLIPKTYLINYYQNQFGFVQMGRQLATFGENAKRLVTKFLDDEEV